MKLEKTITSIFLVPVLGLDKSLLKNYNYLNSYSDMKDKEIDYPPHVVYILFKPKSLTSFQSFVEDQYADPNSGLLEDFNIEKELVVLVYKLDDKFKKDIELVKASKYSKTSKKFQQLFPEIIKFEKDGVTHRRKSLQNLVFNKDQSLLNYWSEKIGTKILANYDMEVWYSFEPKKETLDITSILNKLEKYKQNEIE